MYAGISKDIDRVWCVTAYGQWSETGRNHYNNCLNVIAKTAEEAIQKVRDKYVKCEIKIVSVNHKGAVDIA